LQVHVAVAVALPHSVWMFDCTSNMQALVAWLTDDPVSCTGAPDDMVPPGNWHWMVHT
jgi:hypothetical protein